MINLAKSLVLLEGDIKNEITSLMARLQLLLGERSLIFHFDEKRNQIPSDLTESVGDTLVLGIPVAIVVDRLDTFSEECVETFLDCYNKFKDIDKVTFLVSVGTGNTTINEVDLKLTSGCSYMLTIENGQAMVTQSLTKETSVLEEVLIDVPYNKLSDRILPRTPMSLV